MGQLWCLHPSSRVTTRGRLAFRLAPTGLFACRGIRLRDSTGFSPASHLPCYGHRSSIAIFS